MKFLAICITSLSLFAMSGCNTFKGLGQDIQKAGTKIEDAAKKN